MTQTLESPVFMLKEIPKNFETFIELIKKSSFTYSGFGGETAFNLYLDSMEDNEYKFIIKIFKDLIGNDAFNNLIEMKELVHPSTFETDFYRAVAIFSDFKKPHKLLVSDKTDDRLRGFKDYLKLSISNNRVDMILSVPDFLFAIKLLMEYPNLFKHVSCDGDSIFYIDKRRGSLIEADVNESNQIVYAGLAELTNDVLNAEYVYLHSYRSIGVLN